MSNSIRAKNEIRRKVGNGPLKLELQVQPSIALKPYPVAGLHNQNPQYINPSSTPIPDPFETVKPNVDPALAASLYQQQQINLNPSYNPLRDQNVLDPQVVNALLHHQYFGPQSQDIYGFRQNGDGSVSTYTTPSTSQNRPPWFNWFGTNNNNNNNNYQNDQQQQGPILGFLTNLAQNNPLTNFLNSFQQNDQPQNPFQSFLTNLNPLNLFSNNNRPQQSISTLPIQSDYVQSMSPPNAFLSNNIDSSVFSNDHFLHPNQIAQNGNYNPVYVSPAFNPGSSNHLQSVNFNPGMGNPTPIYNPNFNPGLGQSNMNQVVPNPYLNQFSTTIRPGLSPNNVQPYSQLFYQNPSSYPIYQNPYQTISPISISSNPNFNRKKTGSKTSKKKNKNKVDVPDTDSDWFHDFLDKRKSASLDVSSRRPTKKSSDEDDDDLEDYFR